MALTRRTLLQLTAPASAGPLTACGGVFELGAAGPRVWRRVARRPTNKRDARQGTADEESRGLVLPGVGLTLDQHLATTREHILGEVGQVELSKGAFEIAQSL